MRKGEGKVSIILCILRFVVAFIGGIASKQIQPKELRELTKYDESKIGEIKKDIAYGDEEANMFDIYLPKDNTKETYGLVVYLHAGGFTTGDKQDDVEMLKWLCARGYVAVGINYTLRTDENEKSVYTQSMEIKSAIPVVIEEVEKLGYKIDKMAMSGGLAGGTLALIYAYRDAKESPVPVKMVFEAVGPSSFYPEDWDCYGFNSEDEEVRKAAAGLFSVMLGKEIPVDMLGTEEYDEFTKDISALYWVDENTVPTVLAYGKYDKVQPYLASVRLDKKLTEYNVPHEYIVFEHSGHGLQNDNKQAIEYMKKTIEYLNKYMPVK